MQLTPLVAARTIGKNCSGIATGSPANEKNEGTTFPLRLISPAQVEFNSAVNAAKQNLRLQHWTAPIFRWTQEMPCDQQLIRSFLAQHVHSYEIDGNDDGMEAVYCDGLDWMQVF